MPRTEVIGAPMFSSKTSLFRIRVA